MNTLSNHQLTVLEKLKDGQWKTQRQLMTSRQTLIDMIAKKIIVYRKSSLPALASPEAGRLYKLKEN